MKEKEQLIAELKERAVIAILRGIEKEKLPPLLNALYQGGIRFAEITFDQKQTVTEREIAEQIAAMRCFFDGKLHIGAGTVMTVQQAELAMHAGAEFLISPHVNPEVIRHTVASGCMSIPGAMTPTEAVTAYENGADFVKIFPADSLGIPYLQALTAPLAHIPMLAVGGVNERNIGDFLRLGLAGVGVGASLMPKAWVEENRFEEVAALAQRYTDSVQAHQKEQRGQTEQTIK